MKIASPMAYSFVVATISSGICALALAILYEPIKRKSQIKYLPSKFRLLKRELSSTALAAIATSILVLIWTGSAVITFPFTFFAGTVTWIYTRNKESRNQSAIAMVWPEVIDHLVSGIHSGLSLSEAMVGLSTRGPEVLRPAFLDFHQDLLHTGDFTESAEKLKARFNSQSSDQILEAVLLAKSLGGSELLQIFRTLGDFIRQDLALRKEIEIKHGWIKNSAHLSSAAPWLLLLLLSSQPGTVESFAQPGGIAILLVGIFLTVVAYFWMGRLGQLPKTPRVFG